MDEQQSISLFAENYIRGFVTQEIFYNEETWYGVIRLKIEETTEAIKDSEVVIVGNFPKPHPDELYTFYGDWKTHARFGQQYVARRYERETPKTIAGVERYLASGLFQGIGKKMAKRIVEQLGVDALTIIADFPERLAEVQGISESRAKIIYESVIEHRSLESAMVFLYDFGIGVNMALRIYQTYKLETMTVLKEEPYRLIEDVQGIGFKRADDIARSTGIAASSEERVKAAALFTLQEASYSEGHVYLPVDELCEKTMRLLDECGGHAFAADEITQAVEALFIATKIAWEDDRVYLPSLFFAELGLAKRLRHFSERDQFASFPTSEFYRAIGAVEDELAITYAQTQRDAIQQAITSGLMLLTGGPGTGKTTVIRGICRVFSQLHGLSLDLKKYGEDNPFPILLVAPTGRAAKRMTETTGLPAMTIHRLLGYKGESFEHDAEHPIQGRLLIIDEMSMVDIWLANQLFRAIPDDMQIIMVGDPDQLPSVGPGNVLQDMIRSGLLPLVQLTEIYRQAEESTIIRLAHDVRKGNVPADLLHTTPDRRFFTSSPQDVPEAVKQICSGAVKKGYTAKDVQVLAPIYKGNAGVNKLNEELQELFNPKTAQKRQVTFGETAFRTGDKVLQLVNNAEEQVFNGDMGEIVAIFFPNENAENEEMLVVSFDGREVTYKRSAYHQLTLAYCCSVHKSQGSEFPIVVMPFVKSYYRMLRRKLVYTGITRSKSFLIMCGEPDAFRAAVETDEEGVRYSYLEERLRQG
ncbi:ATP-dependent RecD-like DNA helicase [Brevibacillus nitrificans]|uniref:SF1B family DNA helicase RecD2 n=1 Tax=Brevibacillus nitrificans TaxID=651560 RepID=UPI00285A50E9|nr:ATP-dependent RecD-like DNA helicase [Brevibacillus nitrificans]MDR7315097.1 exodeoxyribonuclease V alpha subunit [Brevibacillus nitrificans]